MRIAADQQRHNMLTRVRDHGQLAAVEGGVPQAGEPIIRRQLERHEITVRAGNDDLNLGDDHFVPLGFDGVII